MSDERPRCCMLNVYPGDEGPIEKECTNVAAYTYKTDRTHHACLACYLALDEDIRAEYIPWRPPPRKLPTPPPPLCGGCGQTLRRVLSCPRCDAEDRRLSLGVVVMLAFAVGVCAGWVTVVLGWVQI